MKLRAFTVRDGKLQVHKTPFFVQYTGQAERMFQELASDGQSIVSKHKDDFTLVEIGTYDDETAEMVSIQPRIIMHGKDLNLTK